MVHFLLDRYRSCGRADGSVEKQSQGSRHYHYRPFDLHARRQLVNQAEGREGI